MMYLVTIQILSQWVAIGYLAYQSKLMKYNVKLSEIMEYRTRPLNINYFDEVYPSE